ncbi:MAG: hypothetical protein ACPGVO_14065 [Spirulinaceae cyanobacterium]
MTQVVTFPAILEQAERAEKSQKDAVSRLAKLGLNSEQIAEALGLSLGEVGAIVDVE